MPTTSQKPIVLIACCKEKASEPCKAREMYRSLLFRKSVAWAENRGLAWAILSAEYGLVEPDEVIEPYDKTLNRMSAADRRSWASRTAFQIRAILGAGPFIVLAGREYRAAVDGVMIAPMVGLGIGEQLRYLTVNAKVAA